MDEKDQQRWRLSSWGIGLDFQSILPLLNQQSKLSAFKNSPFLSIRISFFSALPTLKIFPTYNQDIYPTSHWNGRVE